MKKGGFMKDALILFMITLIAGACLGGVYEITKEPIALAKQAEKDAAYLKVLPIAARFESDDLTELLVQANSDIAGMGFGKVTVDKVVSGVDAAGTLVGYVATVTSKDGYAGVITLSVGMESDGTVIGIEFLTIEETIGFGMNAQDTDWREKFFGKNVEEFIITKSVATTDQEIDAISGATITSKAVTGAVNGAVYFIKNCLTQ